MIVFSIGQKRVPSSFMRMKDIPFLSPYHHIEEQKVIVEEIQKR